jgi:inner membrane protein
MVLHRGHSHALFWLTLAAPLLAWGIAALHRERHRFGRWWLAMWLALVTHALLDAMTIYGTRLGLPFTDHAFAVGSLFIVDPCYTLPLLAGVIALVWRGAPAARWNRWGLVLSTLYAGWSVAAQQSTAHAARAELARQAVAVTSLVVTPAPLQTLLWRVVALTETRAYEAFRSVLDGEAPLRFTAIDRGAELRQLVAGVDAVQRLERFSGGATRLAREGDAVRITDLRMGREPHYVFSFVVAQLGPDGRVVPVEPTERTGARIDAGRELAWVWARMWGAEVPPPR